MVSKETIRRFFIQKLASIIGQNTNKNLPLTQDESNRLDWLVAEYYINTFCANTLKKVFENLQEKNPEEYQFDEFEKGCGKIIWEDIYGRGVARHIGGLIYTNIRT
jgi:hypothetical protein